jgi:hypothetical protein
MTKLERIIATRAIGESFISNISSELSFERILIETTHFNFHSHTWMISMFVIYLYGHFKFTEGSGTKDIKIQNIQIYGKYNKLIQEMMFIFFLIFTRDVQNAI